MKLGPLIETRSVTFHFFLLCEVHRQKWVERNATCFRDNEKTKGKKFYFLQGKAALSTVHLFIMS